LRPYRSPPNIRVFVAVIWKPTMNPMLRITSRVKKIYSLPKKWRRWAWMNKIVISTATVTGMDDAELLFILPAPVVTVVATVATVEETDTDTGVATAATATAADTAPVVTSPLPGAPVATVVATVATAVATAVATEVTEVDMVVTVVDTVVTVVDTVAMAVDTVEVVTATVEEVDTPNTDIKR